MVLRSPSVVLVFVVEIELNVPAYREEAAGVKCRSAPLAELALVKRLDGDVREFIEEMFPMMKQYK